MNRKSDIPIYDLDATAIQRFELFNLTANDNLGRLSDVHRDNNYLLLFHESGISKAMVDFKEVVIDGAAVFCILPGQVHHAISVINANMWVIAIESSLIKETFRSDLMDFAIRGEVVRLDPTQAILFRDSFLLFSAFNEAFEIEPQDPVRRAMLDVCVNLFAKACRFDAQTSPEMLLRPGLITRQFRGRLMLSFREMKSPAQYASALNISSSYLNEVVKSTTGRSVSYWIQQEIMMEAKRLLYYTNDTVKEIAVSLGYTDVAYFIRLFGKVTRESPLRFRENSKS